MWKIIAPELQQKRDSMPWKEGCLKIDCRYVNFFEVAKVKTVDLPMQKFMHVKTGEKVVDDIRTGGTSLALNILEAMLQDINQGSDDNADAGFEMMSEPNDRRPVLGLGNNIDKEWRIVADPEGSNQGVVDTRPPLPRVLSEFSRCIGLRR